MNAYDPDGKSTIAWARPRRQPHGGSAPERGLSGAGPPLLWQRDVPQRQSLWRSDNDGAGSGLDADLLDGQQGSWYADIIIGDWAMPRCNRERVSASGPMPSRWAGTAASCS
jgi:hypothetical protein